MEMKALKLKASLAFHAKFKQWFEFTPFLLAPTQHFYPLHFIGGSKTILFKSQTFPFYISDGKWEMNLSGEWVGGEKKMKTISFAQL
jgi:hypothetical protein